MIEILRAELLELEEQEVFQLYICSLILLEEYLGSIEEAHNKCSEVREDMQESIDLPPRVIH